ncbi:MAG TPA: extracellular solute-binding protein, partial [Chloroflexia bacterium]|nr:extracellular solute-binding protein [Chloroflexia bacterium]
MATIKSRLAWFASAIMVLLPVLSACGGDATPTAVPATNTVPAAVASPTTGAAVTATTGGSSSAMLDALAAEGIKPDTSASGKFEFFSWWTAGGEAEGKNDILNLYKQLYPNVEVIDAAVAGGGGDKAKAVLKTRMQGNDPPDTFQVHGGPELIDGYVKANRMESVSSIYNDMSITGAFPKQLLEMVSQGGEIYSVPANIHRGNELFYNKKVLSDNGITAPTTWDEFFAAAEKLKAKGIAALAVGGKDTWAVTMLFEDILVARGGANMFNDLMAGKADWNDAKVVASLDDLKKIWSSGYVNKDFSALTWDDASGQVLKGTAAMTIMGDWAKGYFQANDPKWADNFGWVASPGTKGVFKVVTDTFGIPKGAKNAENARRFLKLLASKTGQVAFNLRKGSIPARTDVDTGQFDVYMKDANSDFGSAASLVGSAPHGSATTEAFNSALTTAINTFVANQGSSAETAKGLQEQAKDLITGGSSGISGGGDKMTALAAEGITPDTSATGKLEFFSWWTAGGEAEGKNDILNLYKQLYPNVEVIDAAVAGGGGDKAKAVLKTRMQGNDPPDTFQVHGGPEIIDGYVKANRMDPVTSIYNDMKITGAFPKQLLDMVSQNGEIYSVPANIHRGNVLFYNKKVLSDNGITAPTTWDAFFAAAETLKGKGIAALAVGGKDTWAVTMLFEDILLTTGGPQKFNDLMAGKADWTDKSVVDALAALKKIWEGGYVNKDFSALTWDDASGQVLKGTAAMTIMGDWAKGYFQANDPKWADNFGWMPSPGTSGIFKV